MSENIKQNEIVTIKPEQNLVGSTAKSFQFELKSLLKKSPDELTIDLTEVKMIDSVGLGVIIATYNSLCEAGGKLRVTNMSKNLYNHFITMRLDRHFAIDMASN